MMICDYFEVIHQPLDSILPPSPPLSPGSGGITEDRGVPNSSHSITRCGHDSPQVTNTHPHSDTALSSYQ